MDFFHSKWDTVNDEMKKETYSVYLYLYFS
jgi:hypothetical protein